MRPIEVCRHLKEATTKILLLDRGKLVSQGTGVVIDPRGIVLTANHVVKPFTSLSSPTIVGIFAGSAPVVFPTFFGDLSLDVGTPEFLRPLEIDLAVLIPRNDLHVRSFLMLEDDIPSEGTEVIAAGFPEDVKPPLNFSDKIRFDNPEVAEKEVQIRQFIAAQFRFIMFRSAMIGTVFPIYLSGKADVFGSKTPFTTRAAEFWLDNTSVPGASGGPVVNMKGKLLGIVSERGLTSTTDLTDQVDFQVPSGSTMVQSHKLISWSLEKLGETFK